MKLTTFDKLESIIETVATIMPDVNRDMIYLNVLKSFADVVARGRYKAYWEDGAVALLNTYGFIFSGSGSGKDKVNNFLNERFFDGANNVYELELKQQYDNVKASVKTKAHAKYPSERENMARRAYIDQKMKEYRVPELHISDATREGFIAERLALSGYGIGATSVVIPELGKMFRGVKANDTSFFDVVMEAYDGRNNGKATKGDSSKKSCKGVPSNFLAYTTVDSVMKDNKKRAAFVDLFLDGYARRAYVVYDTSKPKTEDALDYESYIANRRSKAVASNDVNDDMLNYFAKLQYDIIANKNKQLELTDEASYEIYFYMKANAKKAIDDSICNEAQHEIRAGRHWKALITAGIFGAIQGKNIVELEDVKNAIAITDYFGSQSTAFLNALTDKGATMFSKIDVPVELFNKIILEDSIIKGDIRTALGGKPKIPVIEDMVEQLRQYADTQGFELEYTKIRTKEIYSLKPKQPTADIPVSLSLCTKVIEVTEDGKNVYDMASPYEWIEPQEGDNCTLQDAMALTTVGNYSAGKFDDGFCPKGKPKKNLRSLKTWLGGNTMLIYDIDAGMNIDEAQSMLVDTASAILTTKSHRKDKNGIACDRFRVFMPLTKPIDFKDANRFKRIMKNVAEAFKLPFDKATLDPSRMFYPASTESFGDCWYSQAGGRLIDWTLFDVETMDELALRKVALNHNATYSFAGSDKATVERGIRKFFLNNYADGNRNHTIFRALRWLKDKGFSQSEAVGFIKELSASSPLPVSEFETTLRSAWR